MTTNTCSLTEIRDSIIDPTVKGIPGGTPPFALKEIGGKGWNILGEDLVLPVAVIRESALAHNSRWMAGFLELTGARLCPHGKTSMSPQLFDLQLGDGAWGITAATVSQIQVYRRYGVSRILLANQLVGKQNVLSVLKELRDDPGFDFFCLIDSVAGVEILARAAQDYPVGRPLQVLLEVGSHGGRTGVRDMETALGVARAVKAAEPFVTLRGIECFEGIYQFGPPGEAVPSVKNILDFLLTCAVACQEQDLFAPGTVILSAGGSAFYDLAAEVLAQSGLERDVSVVLRSGCYLTHDSKWYVEYFSHLRKRMPAVNSLGEGLRPALEVWGYVQSMPDPGRLFVALGKRDISFDVEMPTPASWYRPGAHDRPQNLGTGFRVDKLNDHHCYVEAPPDHELQVGDMMAFGISHPCTTFDKWQILYVVDDDYNVTSALRTFF